MLRRGKSTLDLKRGSLMSRVIASHETDFCDLGIVSVL
jgi:hypothetical protein